MSGNVLPKEVVQAIRKAAKRGGGFFSKTYTVRRLWQLTSLQVLREDQEEAAYRFRTSDGKEFFFDRFGRLQRAVRQ